MKKLYVFLTALTLILSSCGKEETAQIKNEDFVNSFEKTNNALLAASDTQIQGDLKVQLSTALEYESSLFEVGVTTSNEQNIAYYNVTISPQTIISLVKQYTNTGDNIDVLGFLPSYNKSDSKVLIDGGNRTGDYLTFDTSSLKNLYAANQSYLAIRDNKVQFGETLQKYNITTTVSNIDNQNMYVTTMTLTYDDLIGIIPFVDTSKDPDDMKLTIRVYHEEIDGVFEKIDIELVNFSVKTDNELVFANVNISLSFELPVGGETNETE